MLLYLVPSNGIIMPRIQLRKSTNVIFFMQMSLRVILLACISRHPSVWRDNGSTLPGWFSIIESSAYCTCTRPVLEYCAPLFFHALPACLSDDRELIQKRAFSITSPGFPYSGNLKLHNITTLKGRRLEFVQLGYFQS